MTKTESPITIHKAVIRVGSKNAWGGINLDKHWFASLDGENWVEINREPGEGDEADVARCINGNGKTLPLRMATRWLRQQGAEVLS